MNRWLTAVYIKKLPNVPIAGINRVLSGEVAIPDSVAGRPVPAFWRGKRINEGFGPKFFTRAVRKNDVVVGAVGMGILSETQLHVLRKLLVGLIGYERNVNLFWRRATVGKRQPRQILRSLYDSVEAGLDTAEST